eukprot:jgi/Undpi1/6998/HiC_scaffold_21.g09472.m1
MAAAVSVWAHLSAGPIDTVVKGDFVPAKDNCLCYRQTCVFTLVGKHRRLEEEGAPRRCAVCNTSKSIHRKKAGASSLLLFDLYFTSAHATCQNLHNSGGSLGVDSPLCNSCYLDAYRNASKFFKADKSTRDEFATANGTDV